MPFKTYKYKIRRPSKALVAKFEATLDVCRELYNAALQERRDAWRLNRISISYAAQSAQLTDIRKTVCPELAEMNLTVLREPLQRVNKAFAAFFRRVKAGEKAGYPRFKGKSRYDSFTYLEAKGCHLKGDKLTFSKLGTCRLHLSRPVEGTIKTITIKRETDGWYASLLVETNQCRYIPKTGESVGVDVGIENFATLSNGKVIPNPQYLRTAERRLKTAQRSVCRKKRGGNNRKKAAKVISKQHLKIKRQRADFHHKESLKLLRKFDQIGVEDLNIAGMVKNHRLAKSISDAAWGNFILILTNKAESAGRRVVKVPAHHTSQLCSGCGTLVIKSLSERKHKCGACGLILHRDHNAALNIQARACAFGDVSR